MARARPGGPASKKKRKQGRLPPGQGYQGYHYAGQRLGNGQGYHFPAPSEEKKEGAAVSGAGKRSGLSLSGSEPEKEEGRVIMITDNLTFLTCDPMAWASVATVL